MQFKFFSAGEGWRR